MTVIIVVLPRPSASPAARTVFLGCDYVPCVFQLLAQSTVLALQHRDLPRLSLSHVDLQAALLGRQNLRIGGADLPTPGREMPAVQTLAAEQCTDTDTDGPLEGRRLPNNASIEGI